MAKTQKRQQLLSFLFDGLKSMEYRSIYTGVNGDKPETTCKQHPQLVKIEPIVLMASSINRQSYLIQHLN
jgi:hypothetical protein